MLICVFYACCGFPAFAQEIEMGEEELFFRTEEMVTTASKHKQNVMEAPAIMTVITAEEIHKMGVDTLYDVLRYVPGATVIETYYGYSSVTFRGITQTHYNDKSLLLINGHHPLYDVVVGSYYLEQIPISVIERIEVIRGPGSVLYGTNAFAGVINVITKNGRDFQEGRVSLKSGSNDLRDGSMVYGAAAGDFDFLIGGNYRNSSGYDFYVPRDEAGISGTIPYENDYGSVFASCRHGDTAVRAMFFRNQKDKFGITPVLAGTGERELTGWDLDFSYEKEIGDGIGFNAYAWYDYLEKEEQLEHYPPSASGVHEYQEYAGHKWGTEFQLDYRFTDDVNLLGGLVYEGFLAKPYLFVDSQTGITDAGASPYADNKRFWDLSPYLQVDWKPFARLGLVAGLRYDYNSDTGSNFSPRGGAIYEVAEDTLFAKALYGQAYRSPSVFEKHVHTPNVLMGNANLDPERVSTFDLGLEYLTQNHRIGINYFLLNTEDMITRNKTVPAGQDGCTRTTPQYGNAEGVRIQGLEAEIKGSPLDNLSYFWNVSYKFDDEDKTTSGEILYLEHWVSSLGINWQALPNLEIGNFLNYIGGRKGKLSQTLGGAEIDVDPYLLWNLKAGVKLRKEIELSLIINNLLNTSYAYPEYIRRNMAEIPGGPGREFLGEIVYSF